MRQDQLVPVINRNEAFDLFNEYIQSWLVALDLDKWTIELVRNTDEGIDADWASCSANPAYKRAKVEMNPRRFVELGFTPLQIESVAVHELVHAIIWTGYNEIANPQIPEEVKTYFEEFTTDWLAHSLMMAKYKNNPAVATLWQGYKVR